jgi:hypothetical protein
LAFAADTAKVTTTPEATTTRRRHPCDLRKAHPSPDGFVFPLMHAPDATTSPPEGVKSWVLVPVDADVGAYRPERGAVRAF